MEQAKVRQILDTCIQALFAHSEPYLQWFVEDMQKRL